MAGTPDGPQPNAATPPPEPFIRPERGVWGQNTPTAMTNPIALYIWGAIVTIGGFLFPFILIGVMPVKETGPVIVVVCFGVVIVGLGLLTLYAGRRRQQWEREDERVMGYKPGQDPR